MKSLSIFIKKNPHQINETSEIAFTIKKFYTCSRTIFIKLKHLAFLLQI